MFLYGQFNHGRHEKELKFYTEQAVKISGKTLELACGTGMILLPLLEKGIDAYGIDISESMLEKLYEKAKHLGIKDIKVRAIKQNMVSFNLESLFDAIFIPARSFTHIIKQEDQITCLTNIYKHLSKNGKFILNFFTPEIEEHKNENGPEEIGIFDCPYTKQAIRLKQKQKKYLSDQVQEITWQFEYGNKVSESKMLVRRIYKKEFEELLRAGGFKKWNLFGGFDYKEYSPSEEMVWIVEK